ncbi:MAG: hypothetical protein IKI05_06230 [Bacteroidaceae bacterium]|nr:hypothetical protein [Bacteroidaceae bacterium]
MSQITTTDNSNKKIDSESDLQNLAKIADIQIKDLKLDDNPNLLVFPRDLHRYGDEISENNIINIQGDKIATGNIMGFVGVNDTQLDIKSRFAKEDGDDYFLHYMLQKVFSINLFDIKHTTRQEDIFDFLLYLFPHFLKKALSQGLFKKYRRYEYNDANIRGPIDVNRHIRENIPFRGTVAYSTREHSYDNEVTQLLRHTIEYIRTKEHGAIILNNDPETKSCITQITLATQSYNVRERVKVINQNLRPIRHPYYSAYTDLQNLCLRILRHESIKYGQEKDKVYGVLFDGAWLWEEYLNTILKKCGFKHPENKKHKGGFNMFEEEAEDDEISRNSRRLYPDFWNDNFILDAKYKRLNKDKDVAREDLYQVVTYMYCTEFNNGGFVYPDNEDSAKDEKNEDSAKYQLKGYKGYIHLLPFHVPQSSNEYESFIKSIKESEESIAERIREIQK